MPRTPLRGKLSATRVSQRRRRDRAKPNRKRRLRFEPLEDRRVLATITGQVIWDLDVSGTIEQDEPGLKDWRVYIDSNSNNRFDEGEIFSLTDADGFYRFEDVTTGYYVLAREPQDGC